MFSKKPTVKATNRNKQRVVKLTARDKIEQMKSNQRELNRAQRGLVRDRTAIERQEKQLEMEIKKMAKMGNREAATQLAKQLINLRKQKTRTFAASSRITAVGYQAKGMQATAQMAQSMGTATKAMGAMNKQVNPQQVAKTMQDFERESAKMGMSEEMINDSLDTLFDESGDEEEQDAIVSQVLDEIGIEITGKLADAPSARQSMPAKESNKDDVSDKDIEAMLAQLKA